MFFFFCCLTIYGGACHCSNTSYQEGGDDNETSLDSSAGFLAEIQVKTLLVYGPMKHESFKVLNWGSRERAKTIESKSLGVRIRFMGSGVKIEAEKVPASS